MTLEIDWVTVDCSDAQRIARFWVEALGYEFVYSSPEEEEEKEVLIGPKGGSGCRILFGDVPDRKTVKNRLHLDLRPDDRDAEVERLIRLGARKIDIGQGEDVTWVVMADPEGNEFCILRARTPEEEAATAPQG